MGHIINAGVRISLHGLLPHRHSSSNFALFSPFRSWSDNKKMKNSISFSSAKLVVMIRFLVILYSTENKDIYYLCDCE